MNCARCTHPEAEHCKGGVAHADHKEEQRMMQVKWRKGTRICAVRRCLQPMCSCVDFITPKEESHVPTL